MAANFSPVSSDDEELYEEYGLACLEEGVQGLVPYQDEPDVIGGDVAEREVEQQGQEQAELDINDDLESVVGTERLGNEDVWCECSRCHTETLENEEECRCCADFPAMSSIISDQGMCYCCRVDC